MSIVIILFVVLVLAAAGVGLAVAVARSTKNKVAASNRLRPDLPTNAPAAWAGDHSVEAKLHRRLRDAMRSLGATPALAGPSLIERRLAVEQRIITVDEQLIAAAPLAAGQREEPLRQIAAMTEEIEGLIQRLVTASSDQAAAALESTRSKLDQQLGYEHQARAELEAPGAQFWPPPVQPADIEQQKDF